jgi:hypothetical protein
MCIQEPTDVSKKPRGRTEIVLSLRKLENYFTVLYYLLVFAVKREFILCFSLTWSTTMLHFRYLEKFQDTWKVRHMCKSWRGYREGSREKKWSLHCIESEVFTVAGVTNSVFWDITLCIPAKVNQLVGGTYHLHIQDGRVIKCASFFWRWKQYILTKRRSTLMRLHGRIYQKTEFFKFYNRYGVMYFRFYLFQGDLNVFGYILCYNFEHKEFRNDAVLMHECSFPGIAFSK